MKALTVPQWNKFHFRSKNRPLETFLKRRFHNSQIHYPISKLRPITLNNFNIDGKIKEKKQEHELLKLDRDFLLTDGHQPQH